MKLVVAPERVQKSSVKEGSASAATGSVTSFMTFMSSSVSHLLALRGGVPLSARLEAGAPKCLETPKPGDAGARGNTRLAPSNATNAGKAFGFQSFPSASWAVYDSVPSSGSMDIRASVPPEGPSASERPVRSLGARRGCAAH